MLSRLLKIRPTDRQTTGNLLRYFASFRRSAANTQNRYPTIDALVKPAGKNLTGRVALSGQFILVVAS